MRPASERVDGRPSWRRRLRRLLRGGRVDSSVNAHGGSSSRSANNSGNNNVNRNMGSVTSSDVNNIVNSNTNSNTSNNSRFTTQRLPYSRRFSTEASRTHRRFGRNRETLADRPRGTSSNSTASSSSTSTTASPPAVEDTTLVAVVNRIFEDYHFPEEEGLRPSRRRPLRFPAQYFVRALDLPAEEREMLLGMRSLRVVPGRGACMHGERATDDEISALPSVVLDKEEKRSLAEIFAEKCEKVADVNESGQSECAICLADFEVGDEVTALPCGHLFHLEGCVRVWLKNHSATCPTCRAEIVKRSGNSRHVGNARSVSQESVQDDVASEAFDMIMRTIATSQAEWREGSLSRDRSIPESSALVL